MKQLSVEHLLGIKYINKNDIDLIFETANYFKEVINRPIKKVPSLRDITIANLFFENSTRTKLSFELAEKRLSADVINFSAGQSSVKKGETLIDTVNNILSMKVDIVVMRHHHVGAGVFLSKHVNAKIINAGDGTHEHPTQALLDSFSIKFPNIFSILNMFLLRKRFNFSKLRSVGLFSIKNSSLNMNLKSFLWLTDKIIFSLLKNKNTSKFKSFSIYYNLVILTKI